MIGAGSIAKTLGGAWKPKRSATQNHRPAPKPALSLNMIWASAFVPIIASSQIPEGTLGQHVVYDFAEGSGAG